MGGTSTQTNASLASLHKVPHLFHNSLPLSLCLLLLRLLILWTLLMEPVKLASRLLQHSWDWGQPMHAVQCSTCLNVKQSSWLAWVVVQNNQNLWRNLIKDRINWLHTCFISSLVNNLIRIFEAWWGQGRRSCLVHHDSCMHVQSGQNSKTYVTRSWHVWLIKLIN